jgi:hypothetical protein
MLCSRRMPVLDLRVVERLARMGEDELAVLVARLEYYPADAPTLPLASLELQILDVAINLRAVMLHGSPVSAEREWLELAGRPELVEHAHLVNDIAASSIAVGVRERR